MKAWGDHYDAAMADKELLMSNETPPPVPPYQAPLPAYAKPAPSSDKYNVLAIVSLVSAFFISLVAIITGHLALGQIKRTGEKGRGLAIAGLILGYLGILAGIVTIILVFVIVAAAQNDASNNDSFSDPLTSSSPEATSDSGLGSGSADGSAQTTTAACAILTSGVSDSASSLSENFSSLQSDPTAAVAALQNLSSDFDTAISQINNPDVLAVATTANSDLKSLIGDVQALQADPTGDTSSLLSDATAVQTSFSSIGTVCG